MCPAFWNVIKAQTCESINRLDICIYTRLYVHTDSRGIGSTARYLTISSTVLLKEKWKRGLPEGNGKINLFNRCVGHVNRMSNRGLSIMYRTFFSFGQWRVYKFSFLFFFLMWKKNISSYRWFSIYQIKDLKRWSKFKYCHLRELEKDSISLKRNLYF